MQISEILTALEEIAPLADAEAWDNVGLIVGDRTVDVSRVLLCIDYTATVADEAVRKNCELVVAYHPPLFKPTSRLTADKATALIFGAARRGIALYSPHTALDVAIGGTNDVLADLLGLGQREPLRLSPTQGDPCRLVTFVPREALDRVAQALFDAGAGQIGDYAQCSFQTEGYGTFLGGKSTNPTAGEAGKFERVPEIKIETVLPMDRVTAVVAALKASHPYEEPAFDLQRLAAPPNGRGTGRIGVLDSSITVDALATLVKNKLGLSSILTAGLTRGPVNTVAVCAGAGGDLLDDAITKSADAYVTGELRHHDALKAAQAGMAVVCTLHSNSERCALPPLRERLMRAKPGLSVLLAEADVDPFQIR
jgi:dinuclear metal center YbgI/SA1388 family protein